NKIDLLDAQPRMAVSDNHVEIHLSARTGAGIDMLREQILKTAGWQTNQTEEGLFMARQRHLESLHTAQQHINVAWTYSESESSWELLAEELRIAQEALSSITGRFTADDLLGKIFSEFCIGK
ncbi:MAG: hypothetical protein KDC99_19350, partial [Cyclobacteriaceae bacterium]|nr:hypothetical protein [Cyclobacteriaceae bacterium]